MSKSVASLNNGTLQGIIFKKCDRSNCKPSNKACSAGTCQHTCEPSAVDRCSHKWTLRYSANGRQSEKSYATLALAKDARLKLNTTKREQGRTFVDPKLADEMFLANAEQFIRTSSRLRANDKTRHDYLGKLRTTIAPVFGNRTLAQMATEQAAEDVAAFLNVTLAGKNVVYRQHARMIIVWTMDAAVKAGKVASHKLIGITLADGTHVTRRAQRAMDDDDESGTGFVFITDDQVAQLADGMTATRPTKTGKARTVVLQGVGLAAWLQRTMGLRIREALGVEKSDFKVRRDGSVILKLRSQASVDGKTRVPLKHRRAGEGREIPVPPMVWAMVEDLPDGPLCPGTATPYMPYGTAQRRFGAIMDALGITGYTTHSLRHQFASESLDDLGVQNIAVLAKVLGHASAETTLRVYVHATPDATERFTTAMNARWGTKPQLRAVA